METTCGIYLYSTTRKKILACHATKSRWNNWSIPKGLKEEDEDCFSAAVRELYEECGLKLNDISVLLTVSLPPVKYQKQKKTLESFLIVTDSALEDFEFSCKTYIRNEYPEVDKWKWIDPGKDGHLLHETQQRNIPRVLDLVSKIETLKTET